MMAPHDGASQLWPKEAMPAQASVAVLAQEKAVGSSKKSPAS